MNETDRSAAAQQYLDELAQQLRSGQAREHAYRPALQRLMTSFDDVNAINDPARSENGNPDFVFLKDSNRDIILGYAEAKDITVDLNKTLKTEQLRRYAGYEKLFLTNYRDFIFLASGEEYLRISIGELSGETFTPNHDQALHLMSELQAFLEKKPEAIKSGRRLAVIMGGKARRIRDNVAQYLEHETSGRNVELEKIYGLMKTLLVHDLTKKDFADLYAQTLVYGLFAARYNDETPDNFDRREAVEAVPKTNPFLRQFFNHIAGADFDARLRYIVDELCEVFSISDIRALVKHQATKFAVDDEQDLTIHFYEDFLKEYDPVMRQKMGVYYTPVPVVRYIVRSVDKILKEEFGIKKGLASDETITHTVETQPWRKKGERKDRLTKDIEVPRVQVLDPAVGTATFLNETIKHIYKSFAGQEGRWPAYAKDNLVKRLHGFELMMAPYTIAHLKLSMTLRETGVDDITDRLGVYLTNTLEEGVPTQQDLLSLLGLAGAVSEESQHAADIKTNQPIMVVMGNPPYSGESSNNTPYANSLINKYKYEPGGQSKLQERNPKWLNDDYVKFIAFAENMINKNASGVLAMITNNGYLDNPTFRGMRWHLAKSFDKIYILDLHGNAKKNETAPDGTKDVNVFDIMQGVGVVIAVKTTESKELASVYHAEVYGGRKKKFDILNADNLEFNKISLDPKNLYFVPKNTINLDEYELGISLNELMPINSVGVVTSADDTLINMSKDALLEVLTKVRASGEDKKITKRLQSVELDEDNVIEVAYRPFDNRSLYYDTRVVERSRENVMRNFIGHNNVGLVFNRRIETNRDFADIFVADSVMDARRVSLKETNYIAPLFVYHEDGTKTYNLSPNHLAKLVSNLDGYSPEDILDYIYAVLHSPSYRVKYKEFLKTDFPRVPVPTQVDYDQLVPLGRYLRELHLMKSPIIDDYETTFPEGGSDVVEKLNYTDNKVWINENQYFGNVPELAWSFYVGGYQPAQKWLKDRKGRPLSDADLDHYQKIIKVLLETDRIMKQIG